MRYTLKPNLEFSPYAPPAPEGKRCYQVGLFNVIMMSESMAYVCKDGKALLVVEGNDLMFENGLLPGTLSIQTIGFLKDKAINTAGQRVRCAGFTLRPIRGREEQFVSAGYGEESMLWHFSEGKLRLRVSYYGKVPPLLE